jgi:hypothetical protein
MTDPDMEALIREAGRLEAIMQKGRAKIAEGQAIVDSHINAYTTVQNRIFALTHDLISRAARDQQGPRLPDWPSPSNWSQEPKK